MRLWRGKESRLAKISAQSLKGFGDSLSRISDKLWSEIYGLGGVYQ